MSNSNFNNGKRHIRDRAYYGGTPNQKKKVKFMTSENKKYHFKYNFESMITMLLIAAGWEGDSVMKILALFFAFVAGWSYWKED